MEVGETDVEQVRIALGQPLAELANSGAGIEDQGRAVGELDLDTRGVAAVADGRGSRRGQRSPRAPDADDHGSAGSSQKIDMTPTTSSGCEKSGNAVTVISRSRPSNPRIAKESWTGRRCSSAMPPGVCSAVKGFSSSVRGSKSSCQCDACSAPTST